MGQVSAKMTVHGLHTGDGSTITLCPNDTYLIYIECDVAGSLLQWTFGQLRNPVLFTPGFDVGLDVLRSPITVTLTEKLPNKYVSQLKTFSNELRNALGTDRAVELSCLASSNVKDTVSIVVPVEHKPSIDNASLIENELKVMWSTTTSDIVTVAVVIENIEKGFQSTTFVEWNKREETILVETDKFPYNATVIVYDRCRESYKSDVYTVQRDNVGDNSPSILPSLSSPHVTDKTHFSSSTECVSTPSVVLLAPTTPSPSQDCNREEALVVALSIVLIAFISLVGILIFGIGIWWNKKKKSASSKGGFLHQDLELQEPKDKDNNNENL
jgi:hypothetical protein